MLVISLSILVISLRTLNSMLRNLGMQRMGSGRVAVLPCLLQPCSHRLKPYFLHTFPAASVPQTAFYARA